LGGDVAPAFVPVAITSTAPAAAQNVSRSAVGLPAWRARSGLIEIELGDSCRVRVDRDVDADALRRVLEVLRQR